MARLRGIDSTNQLNCSAASRGSDISKHFLLPQPGELRGERLNRASSAALEVDAPDSRKAGDLPDHQSPQLQQQRFVKDRAQLPGQPAEGRLEIVGVVGVPSES